MAQRNAAAQKLEMELGELKKEKVVNHTVIPDVKSLIGPTRFFINHLAFLFCNILTHKFSIILSQLQSQINCNHARILH